MKIVTIINYDDNHNYNVMCETFIKTLIKYNPECELDILHEKPIAHHILHTVDQFSNVKTIKCSRDPGCWSSHVNICFKLFNLCRVSEPFIFLDVDIFCFDSLKPLWRCIDDKPFIAIDHQVIPGNTDHLPYKFLNSGVQIIGDPEWYRYDKFRDAFNKAKKRARWKKGSLSPPLAICPGNDQANIFAHCKQIDYDYTHPDIGYRYNSCAKHGSIHKTGNGDWSCTYNCPVSDDMYDVALNHYWWRYKPWNLNCPVFQSFMNNKT